MVIFLSNEKYFRPLAKKIVKLQQYSVFDSFEPQSERNKMGPKKDNPHE